MSTFFNNHQELIWPLVLFFAWLFGEIGQDLTKIPKISFYVLFGFILAKHQFGVLPNLHDVNLRFLINVIAGLVLFEFGYRINLSWLRNNPFIIVTALSESIATFIVVFIITRLFGISTLTSLQFAAIFMATSPFVIIYVINQQQSTGQVTERVLHLTALNCIFAIFIFKLILGALVFQKSGSLPQAAWAGIVMLALSILLGIICAVLLANILRFVPSASKDRTVSFVLVLILIAAIANFLTLSATVATLAFGVAARYLHTAMGRTQRNFGALGDLVVVLLFVAVPLSLNWQHMFAWLSLACALFVGRLFTKVVVVALFSKLDGLTWTKGILTGFSLMPVSIFPILILDQTQFVSTALNQDLIVLSALVLFLELTGPVIVQYCLKKARESI